jgi:D-ribose pyranose/furanose isomerase RbsD
MQEDHYNQCKATLDIQASDLSLVKDIPMFDLQMDVVLDEVLMFIEVLKLKERISERQYKIYTESLISHAIKLKENHGRAIKGLPAH